MKTLDSKEFLISSIDGLEDVASYLISIFNPGQIILLRGDLGVGKTSLVKCICKQLSSNDEVTSPSYSLINEYLFEKGTIFHMDMYRLKSVEEVIEIGIEEYLDQEAICFIEWPDLVFDLINEPYIIVSMRLENELRNIEITQIEN